VNFPTASAIITQWISDNFDRAEFHLQRYKAIAWLLNENPDYIIDNKIIIDDFEFANRCDTNVILNAYYDDKPLTFTDERYAKAYWNSVCKRLISRPYCSVICREVEVGEVPDFTKLQSFFTKNLTEIKNQTMLWAVAVSKLPTNTKAKLLKKHYSPACFWTLLNIAKRYKMLLILEWMKKQGSAESIFCEIELDKTISLEKKEDTFHEWNRQNTVL
jgi:hypothetical protein